MSRLSTDMPNPDIPDVVFVTLVADVIVVQVVVIVAGTL